MTKKRTRSTVYSASPDKLWGPDGKPTEGEFLSSVDLEPWDDHGGHIMVGLTVRGFAGDVELVVSGQYLLEAVAEAAGWEVGPYLDQAECAELVGLSLSSFKSYRSARNETFGFPEPDRKFGSHPVWLLSTVERFIRSRVNSGVDRTPQDVRE